MTTVTPMHPADLMAVHMARQVRDRETVFVGVNSPLPMVAVLLARALHAPNSTFLTIAGGVNPQPVDLTAATTDSVYGTNSGCIIDNPDFYDLVGRGGIDLTFLGAAVIDRHGHINSSFLGSPDRPTVRLPGGGGAAYILPLARRVIVWRTKHTRRVFVDDCGFTTSAGNLTQVVTPLCAFAATADGLQLDAIFPGVAADRVADSTGFPIEAAGAATLSSPTPAELEALHALDPQCVRCAEFA